MAELIENSYRDFVITQDLGLGMMLWCSHFFPSESWARLQKERAVAILGRMWVEPDGYFCREPNARRVRFAFTNYGVAIGLLSVGAMPVHVARLRMCGVILIRALGFADGRSALPRH